MISSGFPLRPLRLCVNLSSTCILRLLDICAPPTGLRWTPTTPNYIICIYFQGCSMVPRKFSLLLSVFLLAVPVFAQQQTASKPKPRVIVVGVNGMEMDIIRPLMLKGQMPNLSKVIENGAYGKLRTVSAPNCPRVYSTLFTSTNPEEHGVTGFIVGGITANTNML